MVRFWNCVVCCIERTTPSRGGRIHKNADSTWFVIPSPRRCCLFSTGLLAHLRLNPILPNHSGKWHVFISSRRQVQPIASGGPRPGVVGGATQIPPCCLTLEM